MMLPVLWRGGRREKEGGGLRRAKRLGIETVSGMVSVFDSGRSGGRRKAWRQDLLLLNLRPSDSERCVSTKLASRYQRCRDHGC